MDRSMNAAACLGRVALALIFVLSAAGKLAAPDATVQYIASAGVPLPGAAYWGSVAVELGGGLALMSGLGARVAALVLAVFSIIAALYFHSHFADQNQMIHFLKNVAISGGLLQVAAFGAGAFSLDAVLHRHRRPDQAG